MLRVVRGTVVGMKLKAINEKRPQTAPSVSIEQARVKVRDRIRTALRKQKPDLRLIGRLASQDVLLSLILYEEKDSPRSAVWVASCHSQIADLLVKGGAEDDGASGAWERLIGGVPEGSGGGNEGPSREKKGAPPVGRHVTRHMQALPPSIVRAIVSAYESSDDKTGGSVAAVADLVGVTRKTARKYIRIHCAEGQPLPPLDM